MIRLARSARPGYWLLWMCLVVLQSVVGLWTWRRRRRRALRRQRCGETTMGQRYNRIIDRVATEQKAGLSNLLMR